MTNETTTVTAAAKVSQWTCKGMRPINAVMCGRELAICDVAEAFAKRLARRHGRNVEVAACRLYGTSRAMDGSPRYEYEVVLEHDDRSGQCVTNTEYMCLQYHRRD